MTLSPAMTEAIRLLDATEGAHQPSKNTGRALVRRGLAIETLSGFSLTDAGRKVAADNRPAVDTDAAERIEDERLERGLEAMAAISDVVDAQIDERDNRCAVVWFGYGDFAARMAVGYIAKQAGWPVVDSGSHFVRFAVRA